MKQLQHEINQATEEDIPDILRLLEEHVSRRYWKDTLPYTPDLTEANVREQLNNPDIYFAIARVNGKAEGLMYALAAPPIWNASRMAMGAVWYVNPDLRGSGIGWALATSMRLWARSRGYAIILLGAVLEATEEKNGLTPSEKIYMGKV